MPWLAIITLLLGVFLAREARLGTFADADGHFLDWLVANSQPVRVAPPETILVELRNDSEKETTPRDLTPLECALFFQAISQFDPPVVVAEPVLAWKPPQREGEQMLLQRALKLSRLVAGNRLGEHMHEDEEEGKFPENLTLLRNVQGDASLVPEFRSIEAEPFEELTVGAERGFTNLPERARSERVRHVPLLFRFRGEFVPSVVLQSLIQWLRLTPADVNAVIGESIRLGNKIEVPIDRTGAILINFKLLSILRRLSVDDVLLAAEMQEAGQRPEIDADEIRKSIVFFGPTSATPGEEVLRLPNNAPAAPVSVFALASATIQSGLYIQQAPPWSDYAAIAGVAVFGYLLLRVRRGLAFLLSLAFLGVYGLIALWIFESSRLWLPFSLPAMLLGFVLLVRLFLRQPRTRKPASTADASAV